MVQQTVPVMLCYSRKVFQLRQIFRKGTYYQVLNNFMFIQKPFLQANGFSKTGEETQSRWFVYFVPDDFLGSFFRYVYSHVLKHVGTAFNECH
jgi:hypothetical protein